ncbi:uncharacterized protein LOC127843913 [Dreissena polymorpha]|nr:uncharacterized protein LOC127843913 [Dreissena polymorpha]
MYVSCSSKVVLKADNLLFPNTPEKMYTAAKNPDQADCCVEFLPPFTLNTTDICFLNETLIHSCPKNYSNVETQEACEAMYVPYLRSDATMTRAYANYFCYLCNSNDTDAGDARCPTELKLGLHDDRMFVVEINAPLRNESQFLPTWDARALPPDRYRPTGLHCKEGMMYDLYKEKCREWYCPLGHTRSKADMSCVPLYTDVIKATFSVSLMIRFVKSSAARSESVDEWDLTHDVLTKIYGDDAEMERELIVLATANDRSYLFVLLVIRVSENAKFLGKLFEESTYGQQLMYETHNNSIEVSVDFATGIKMELNIFPLGDIFLVDMLAYSALDVLFRANLSDVEMAFQYTFISKLFVCPMFSLEKEEIRDYIDVIDVRVSDLRLYEGEFSRASRYNSIRVCVSDYLRNAATYYEQKLKEGAFTPQAILSVVCSFLSMTGLFLTIVTYIIFDELQTIPGKNNTMLAVHLLIAQILYQFCMDKTEYPNMCIVFGILIHLFWLTAILWMNVCTLHMFRTFVTGQRYRSVRVLDPQVVCYGLYCYGIALAMVAINISVSAYRSGGRDIGYGRNVCYISNPVMVGWVFALPVGMIIILNLGFFFAVVYQISASTMRRSGKSSDRTNTIIYMKLSSLTGVTWIFGYLYLWTNFVPFEYIFIVLNAGQGVFIFMSFICTQRITKLYIGLLCRGCIITKTKLCRCLCFARDYSEGGAADINTQRISVSHTASIKNIKKKFVSKSKVDSTQNPKNATTKLHVISSTSDVFKESAQMAHYSRILMTPGGAAPNHTEFNKDEPSDAGNRLENAKIATMELPNIVFIDAMNTCGE